MNFKSILSLLIVFNSFKLIASDVTVAPSLSLSHSNVCSPTTVTVTVSNLTRSGAGTVTFKYRPDYGGSPISLKTVNFENVTSVSTNIYIDEAYRFSAFVSYSDGTGYNLGPVYTNNNSVNGGTLTINGGQGTVSICQGDQITINLAGSSGTTTWYRQEENQIWTSIGNQGSSYTVTPAYDTKYKVTSTGFGCQDDSNTITVNLVSSTVAGSISSPQSNQCGSGSMNFSISGHTGTVHRWQYRYKNGSGGYTGWTTFEEINNVTTKNLSLSQWNSGQRTYQIRAVVQSGSSCSTLYPTRTVTVDPVTVGGAISRSVSSICGNGSVNFSISGHTGTVHRWQYRYKNGSGSYNGWTTFEESNNVTSKSLSVSQWSGGTRTYQVQAVVKSGSNCSTLYPKQTVTIKPIPSLASGSNQSRCGSGTVTLTASPGSNGNTIRWYSASSGGTLLYTGTSYTTPSLSSNKTYYAASYNSSTGCLDSDRKAITAIINPIPALASGSNQSRCGSGSVNLTANPGNNGNTIRWYSAASGGSLLHTGTSFSTPSLSSNTTYYAASYNSSTGCLDSDRKAITAIINPIPALASGSDQSRCGNGSVNLNASPGSNGNTIRWYSAASGGSLLHTGTSFSTPSLSSNTTYYAASYNSTTGCMDSDRKAITAIIDPIPSLASGSNQSRCGSGVLTLIASPGSNGNTIRWYNAASGGSLLHTGKSYSTPSLSSNTIYYAASYNSSTGCLDSDRKAITAIINPIPALASGSNQSRCGNGSVTLTASPGSNGSTIRWYSASSGGSLLHTGTSFSTPSLSSNTTYYAASYNSSAGCLDSDRKAITAIINPIPALASGSNQSRCGNGSVNLNASPGSNGNTIRWYSATSGGSLLHTGTSFSTPSLNSNKTYYAASFNSSTGCEDIDRKAISAILDPIPTLASGSNQSRCGDGTVTLTASPGSSADNIRWYSAASGGTLLHTGVSYTTANLSSNTTFYAASFNNSTGCEDTDRKAISVTVNTPSYGGTSSGSTEDFGVASGVITLSEHIGNIVKWQYKTTGSWENISNTTTTLSFTNVQETTQYRAVVKNANCGTATSDISTVTILNVPSVDLGITQQVRPGIGTILTASTGHANYEWYRNDDVIQSGSDNALAVDRPGTYKVTVTSNGNATYTTGEAIIGNQLETNENAVITYAYRVPVTNVSDPYQFSVDEQNITTSIYDGLGKPVQQISLQSTPSQNDLIVPIEYDSYGRRPKSYLPYPDSDLTLLYRQSALNESDYTQSEQYAFYTDSAFSETRFESSPLNRPLEQGAPGEDWQLGQHTVTYNYGLADAGKVIDWNFESLFTVQNQSFADSTLFKNTTTDEDGNQTIEYTNSMGQTILKKSQVDETNWAETYYIYDIYGQLSVVLPPEATSKIDADFFTQNEQGRKDFLNTWAFLYDYDGRNRMTMKKVPGADSIFMVYDQWNRLVLTQDGNQRHEENAWSFTKYDMQNRPIMTGALIIPGSTQQVRELVNSSNGRFETFNGIGPNQYSDETYPPHSNIAEYHTVTYYDSYDFDDHISWNSLGLGFNDSESQLSQNTAVKGQVTGTMTKANDGSWIRSVSYYDDKYQVIQIRSTNHLGGTDIVTNYYDFIGQILKTTTIHDDGGNTTAITREFEYDHVGRLNNTFHQLSKSVYWEDKVGVDVSGEDIIKTGADGYGSGGAASIQKLSQNQDGFVEFTIENNYRVLVGFSKENANAHFNTIDYCIYMSPGWSLHAYENGSNKGSLGAYAIGDIIRVERINGTIYFRKNGDLIYTSSKPSSGSLVIDVALYYTGDKVTNAKFSTSTLLAENHYNELGELIEKDLHGVTGGAFAQSLDYTYNMRGWLTSMNDASLSDGEDDLFGMELHYNTNPLDNGREYYNGNISGMEWSNYDANGSGYDQRGYTYTYDKLNRLTAAQHYQNSSSLADNFYDVNIPEYDLNGNIMTLQRRAASTSAFMDNLDYDYQGNQLQYVNDLSGDTLGFNNGSTGTNIDYTYDANGNMTKDRNKGIDSIYYNHLNLPTKVVMSPSGGGSGEDDRIEYLYDAAGIKLQQKVYGGGNLKKTTDYVGEFIYETIEDGDREIALIQHEEGQIVPISPSGGGPEEFDYQYHLKDHLGNVRVTFSTTPENYTMVETFETGEENGWQDLHRQTHTDANTTSGGDEVELLQSGQTGAMIFLSVNKRDTINLSVNANYETIPSNNNFLGTAYNALFTSFDNIYGSGAESGVSSSSTTFDNALSGAEMGGKDDASAAPRAFINYIFFDKEMGYVSAGFTQISTAAQGVGVHEEVVMPEFVADREGYVLAYLSNENQEAVNVHFDDFTVYHGKTNVVSTQDYYPGGLTYNSYTRTASSAQNYKFNGKELQEETGWYDYGARMYMPDVLRWGVIDNYADKYFSLTPYAYAGNNPLKYADPTGDTLVLVTLPGLNSKHSPVQDRQFLVDSRIAEQTVGFATEALNRFKGRLSVNNIFRGVPSSQISTGNTKAKGLSRHQGGFAIDFNGVKGLSDEERGELNSLAEKHGFNPLTDQMKDPPHFSINPLEEGTTLSDAVSENKGHFDQIFSAAKEGNITLNEITNKEGESVGFQIQVTDQSNLSKEQLSELIFNLINFTK